MGRFLSLVHELPSPKVISTETSDQRVAHLNHWVHHYNWRRLRASLPYRSPITRIPMALNNVLGFHS